MQTSESEKIVQRFFDALYHLKAARVIRGKQTFTRAYNINRWNLNSVEKNPSSKMFDPAWLSFLVRDYGISAHWLLTGIGEPLTIKHKKSAQD